MTALVASEPPVVVADGLAQLGDVVDRLHMLLFLITCVLPMTVAWGAVLLGLLRSEAAFWMGLVVCCPLALWALLNLASWIEEGGSDCNNLWELSRWWGWLPGLAVGAWATWLGYRVRRGQRSQAAPPGAR
jgi:hypothetical protein